MKFLNPFSSAVQVILNGISLFIVYKRLTEDLGLVLFGIWSLVLTINVSYPLFFTGIYGSLQRFLPEYLVLNVHQKKLSLIGSSFTIIFGISSLIIIITLLLDNSPILNNTKDSDLELILSASLIPCVIFILINSITLVLYAAFDGYNLVYIKNIILSIQSCFILLLIVNTDTMLTIQETTLIFMWSAIMALALAIFCTWLFLKIKPWELFHFNINVLQSTKQYHNSYFQSNLLGLLFEPINKGMIFIFAGASSVALYEMASKFVLQGRTVLVSMVFSMMPMISKKFTEDPSKITIIYNFLFKTNFQLSIITFSLIIIMLPFLSLYWFNSINITFINLSYLLVGAWFINNLCLPAFAVNSATNGIKYNTQSSFTILLINIIFGSVFGLLGFEQYVVLSWIIAIIIGGIALILTYNKAHSLNNSININSVFQIAITVGFLFLYSWWSKNNVSIKNFKDIYWMPLIFFTSICIFLFGFNFKIIYQFITGKLKYEF